MNAVVAREDGLVAVGTWGAPDQDVPTVWLSPLAADQAPPRRERR
jgi:hypothetical protein